MHMSSTSCRLKLCPAVAAQGQHDISLFMQLAMQSVSRVSGLQRQGGQGPKLPVFELSNSMCAGKLLRVFV